MHNDDVIMTSWIQLGSCLVQFRSTRWSLDRGRGGGGGRGSGFSLRAEWRTTPDWLCSSLSHGYLQTAAKCTVEPPMRDSLR